MVPRVDPWRWRALYLGASQLDEWSDTELKLAFQTLLNNLQGTTKVALLVDGLDEFDGDEHQLQELVDMFLTWGSSSSIKICVSSRPWNLFKDSFADCPQLRLELLTRPDIELYVKDKLDSNRRFATWRQYDPQVALHSSRKLQIRRPEFFFGYIWLSESCAKEFEMACSFIHYASGWTHSQGSWMLSSLQ